MIVSFFEEFPSTENLAKIDLVDWPTKLYLCARSVREFENVKKQVKNKNVQECIYWPILDKHEGYWISPFSKKSALVRVFDEIKTKHRVRVMIDAELPLRKLSMLNPSRLVDFVHNKRLISKFIRAHPGTYVAEYYPLGRTQESLLDILGLHFDPRQYESRVIKMVYHSMHRVRKHLFKKELEYGVREYGPRFLVALGTVCPGILGNEPTISRAQLKQDLEMCKETGVREVVIYRLGGLTRKFTSLLKRLS